MDDKLNALDKLIEAVEAGKPFMSYHMGNDVLGYGKSVADAFEGSLDAAHKLHEALLPGWRWGMDAGCNAGVWNSCDLLPAITGEADTPARAWLLAILRAYRSVQA